jgi:GDPmannose 4,6-dehydratase
LGNLDAKRDWGYAKDYVEAMWLMLQQDVAEDFVIASNETYTVRQFAEMAFAEAGITLEWRGDGVNEIGVDVSTGLTRVNVDPKYFRPAEVDLLWGDASKAAQKLGWKPKTTIQELVKLMVQYDLKHENYGEPDQ